MPEVPSESPETAVAAGLPSHPDRRDTKIQRAETTGNEHDQILQRGGAKPGNVVEQLVIQQLSHRLDMTFQHGEIEDHPARGLYFTAHRHLGMVGVTVHSPARLGGMFADQCVGRLEVKLLSELKNQGLFVPSEAVTGQPFGE